MGVDPRTPVIVGVGQFTERLEDPDYCGKSSVDLAAAAAQAALQDTGADVAAVAAAVLRFRFPSDLDADPRTATSTEEVVFDVR